MNFGFDTINIICFVLGYGVLPLSSSKYPYFLMTRGFKKSCYMEIGVTREKTKAGVIEYFNEDLFLNIGNGHLK